MAQLEKRMVLIVDDTPENIDVLDGILKDEYRIKAALDGEKALKIASAEKPPDLILLDIMMPGMDGYQVCRQLKQNKATQAIPVIFVTVRKEVKDETKGFDLGAVDYITKPFEPAVVKARVKTQVELKMRRDHMEELNELKNKFLGMAAHDLHNPLVAIRGFSELLLDRETGSLTEWQFEYLGLIREASDNMLTLVNDLLDVSVIESGKLELQLKHELLDKIIADRVRLNEIAARAKNTRLHLEFKWRGKVYIDSKRIAQVIDNLISNAVKYSPPNSDIFIRLEKSNEEARISVKDQGPGITPEESKRLFGVFQKLSAKPTGGERSTGLGLSISKRIAKAHNGTIDVESEAGAGSTFYITLPLK